MSVPDIVQVPAHDNVVGGAMIPGNTVGGTVLGWHDALRAGFRNAYARSLKIAAPGEASDFVLTIDFATPEFVPAAVRGSGAVVAVGAQVRYRAFLTGRGRSGVDASIATASRSTTTRKEFGPLLANSIEAMYQTITTNLLAPALKP